MYLYYVSYAGYYVLCLIAIRQVLGLCICYHIRYTQYIYIQAFGGMHSVDTVEVQISKRQ